MTKSTQGAVRLLGSSRESPRFRVCIALCVTAIPAVSAETEAPGRALFDRYCSSCHTTADVSGALQVTGPNLERAKQQLREFLSQHSEAGETQSREIVEYLSSR